MRPDQLLNYCMIKAEVTTMMQLYVRYTEHVHLVYCE